MSAPLPVVLLHGIRFSGAMWEPTARLLRDRREVICPDMPGHGSRRGQAITSSSCVDAVCDAIKSVGGRALVGGISMGGYLSIEAAARLGDVQVAGVVGVGCTARPGSPLRLIYQGVAAAALRAQPAYDRISASALRRMVPAEIADSFLSIDTATESFAEAVQMVSSLDPLADLGEYAGPTWFINGSRDQMRLNERQFLKAARDGHLSVWQGLNHLTVMAHPGRLARAFEDAAAVVERRDDPHARRE